MRIRPINFIVFIPIAFGHCFCFAETSDTLKTVLVAASPIVAGLSGSIAGDYLISSKKLKKPQPNDWSTSSDLRRQIPSGSTVWLEFKTRVNGDWNFRKVKVDNFNLPNETRVVIPRGSIYQRIQVETPQDVVDRLATSKSYRNKAIGLGAIGVASFGGGLGTIWMHEPRSNTSATLEPIIAATPPTPREEKIRNPGGFVTGGTMESMTGVGN